MAKVTIADLDAAGALDGTELVEIEQGGESKQTTTQDIADLGGGGAGYLVYTALLSQTGTDAPVATVLENTLGGTVVWSYNSTGNYTGTLAAAFTENKTWFAANVGYDDAFALFCLRIDGNSIKVQVRDNSGVLLDGLLLGSIEIRVYP